MSEEIFQKIISSLRTVEERDVLYEGISALQDVQYRTGESAEEEILRTKIFSPVASTLQSALRDPFLKRDLVTKKEFLKNLKGRLKSLRILKIDLAFEPKPEIVNSVSRWVKDNVGRDAILEIGFDRTIVGGARITFGGRYLEETLEKILAREFEENRNIIVGMSLRKR